jgi:hypothetical protein
MLGTYACTPSLPWSLEMCSIRRLRENLETLYAMGHSEESVLCAARLVEHISYHDVSSILPVPTQKEKKGGYRYCTYGLCTVFCGSE